MDQGRMSDMSERIERRRRPVKCPQCGHRPMAEILYGMPSSDSWLEQKIKEGRITIGGCCIDSNDPAWECCLCGLKVYRSTDDRLEGP